MSPRHALIKRLRRFVRTHRRLLAATVTALAVLTGLQAVAPREPDTRPVLVAAHDLAAGSVVDAGAVRVRHVPARSGPAHAYSSVASVRGRTLAAPLRSGEPLTDLRLVGRSLLHGYAPGTALSTVPVGDAQELDSVRVGDTVDVLGADPSGDARTGVLVRKARVAALPPRDDDRAAEPTVSVVLAVPQRSAVTLADAAVRYRLSLSLVL